MNDDELTRRLMAARPPIPVRGSALDDRAEQLLGSIIAEAAEAPASAVPRLLALVPPTQTRRLLRPFYMTAAAAVLVLIVAAISMVAFPRGTSAWAATPPPLAAQPIPGTAKELLMGLSESVRANDAPAAASVRFQSWALMFSPDSDELPVAIIPEVFELTHRADDSVRIEVRAGVPYDAGGDQVTLLDVQPGEIAWSEDFEPGEYEFVYPDPPTAAAEYAQYFQAHNPIGEAPTTGDYFTSVRHLLSERPLTGQQQSAILEFLATLPDIRVDGEVVDRLGRPGVSFTTESRAPGEYRDTLVVSPGRGVLSYEATYIGHDRTDIKAPAVLEYTAWE